MNFDHDFAGDVALVKATLRLSQSEADLLVARVYDDPEPYDLNVLPDLELEVRLLLVRRWMLRLIQR